MHARISVFRHALIMMSAAALSSCSIFSPVTIKPSTEYSFTQIPAPHHAKYRSSRIIMVMTPDAAPYYKSTQIAYQMQPHQVSYFTQNAWAEPPAQMLQPLLVKTLQNTNRYRAIVAPPVTGNYDYMLTTQILNLRVKYDTHPAVFEVTIRAQIFNAASNKAIATKDITVDEPICNGPFYTRILAANHAIANALAQIANFTLRVVK